MCVCGGGGGGGVLIASYFASRVRSPETLTLTHFNEYRPTAPFSGGIRDSHEPEHSYVIITGTHYYMHFHIYTRVSIFRPNLLFKVYDNILSRFTYKTLPALSTYLPVKRPLPSSMFLD